MLTVDALGSLRLLLMLGLLCQCSSDPPGVDDPSAGGAGRGGTQQGGTGAASNAGEGNAGEAPQGGSTSGSGGGYGGTQAGAGTGAFNPAFMLGADISSLHEAIDSGATYVDTDGVTKDMLEILANHGFNYVRLRTFMDPNALYGYANPNGTDLFRKPEAYCDRDHTAELGQRIKQQGMGFLLDFHYSDNWADPGKQIIPEAWRGAATIEDLAASLQSYTQDVISTLVSQGARPDMVQIGNEITPGVLIHVPTADPQPDQWGNINHVPHSVNGSTSSWSNLAMLLKAGIAGVKAVDPTIEIMLHVENTESFPSVVDWVENVRANGVELDVLGLSCYTAYQGGPEVWQDTFEQLTANLTDVSFAIAEYNPERTRANQIMRGLPDGRGRGTFFWEPAQSGTWGLSMFTFVNGAYHANSADFAEFDGLRAELGL